MATTKRINGVLSASSKQQLAYRDQQVSGDPFGIKAKGSSKKKSDVITFLHSKYKEKYRKQFLNAARDNKFNFESGIANSFNDAELSVFVSNFSKFALVQDIDPEEIRKVTGTFQAGLFDIFGGRTVDKVNAAADASSKLLENVNGAFEKLSKSLPKWVGLVSFCVFLNESLQLVLTSRDSSYAYKFNYTIWMISGILTSHFLGDCLNLLQDSWSSLWHLIERLRVNNTNESCNTTTFQAGISADDPITAFVSLLLPIVLSIMGLKKTAMLGSMYEKTVCVVKEVLLSFSRMKSGICDVSSLVVSLCNYLYRVVRWTLYDRNSYKFPDWNVTETTYEIDEFCEATSEFCLSADKNEIVSNTSNYFTVLNLISKGEKLLTIIKDRNCIILLQRKLKELNEIKNKITSSGCFIQGARPEPHAIVLEGAPGQGKSSLVDRLHTAIWSKCVPEDLQKSFQEDPLKYQYVRSADVKYWEGYTPEKLTCIYDDYGQSREELTGVCESLELIRAINSYPFHLNYAEITSKANNYFVSRLMLITTNALGYNNSPLLNHQDALHRRLNKNRYRVLLKDRYKISTDSRGRVTEFNENSTEPNVQLGKDRVFNPYHPEKKTPGLLTDEDVDIWKLCYSRDGRTIWYEPTTFQQVVDVAVRNIQHAENQFKLRMEDLANVAKSEDPTLDLNGEQVFRVLQHSLSKEQLSDVISEVDELDGMDLLELYEEKQEKYGETVNYVNQLYGRLAEKFNLAFKTPDISQLIKKSAVGCQTFVNISQLSEANKTIIALVGTGCAIGAALGIAYGVFRLCVAWRDKHTEAMFQGYSPRKQQEVPSRKFAKKIVQPSLVLQAGSVDEKAEQFARKIIKRNLYQINVLGKKLGFCLFVKGTLAILPAHFEDKIALLAEKSIIEGVDPNLIEIEIVHNTISSKSFCLFLPDFMDNIVSMAGMDLAMVDFKRNTVQHCNILDKIHRLSDANYPKGMLCVPETEGLINTVYFRTVKLHYDHLSELVFDNVPLEGKSMVSYADVKTNSGDCGSPLIALGGPNSLRPFIGFHIGSSAKGECARGYAVRVFYEHVETLMSQFEDVVVEDFVEPDLLEDSQTSILGAFESGYISHKKYLGASKSKLVKTILYEWGKNDGSATREPAKLRPFTDDSGSTIVPMEKALLRYDVSSVAIHDDLVDAAKKSLSSMLGWSQVVDCPYKKCVFSFDEAVVGIHGDEQFDAISRSSSPGYPHVLNNHTHGKKFWFGEDDIYQLNNPRADSLRHVVNETISNALKGKRKLWVYLDNLKDELVPKEKALLGKTRLFSATPLELLILYRMYFGAFTSWIARNHTENGIAIGLNPYSHDWDRLAKKLEMFGGNVIAGDFSGFDTRQVPKVLYAILDIINHWYNDGSDNKRVREILWEEIVNSYHIYGDRIYSWTGSLPSGNPITSTINCLYNHMLFRMCWVLGQMRGILPKSAHFNDEVYLCVLGDDNIMTSTIREFNQNFLSESMEVFGQNYTDEFKRAIEIDWRSLDEVSFLKRTFRFDDTLHRYVAPLSLVTVREILWWQRNNKPFLEQASANLELVLREYSLHDPSVWSEAEKIIEHCHLLTHGELLPRYRSRVEYLYEVSEWEQIW